MILPARRSPPKPVLLAIFLVQSRSLNEITGLGLAPGLGFELLGSQSLKKMFCKKIAGPRDLTVDTEYRWTR